MALCLREVAMLRERREFRQIPGYQEHLMASVVTTDKVMAGVLLQENLQLYGVAAFRAFLKTEFSEENLEFWLACEEFKKTRSTAKLVSKAHRIFEEFVDVQAPREVNIDFQTREATRKNMQEPSLTCFDQAQGKVHSLMEKDSYPRFLRSKMYLDLLSQSQRRLS
ncbi:regulator of G-protein signaling 8 [Leptonychotes weddellii]|uniref:Regulator of G-protein signaling 8 n=1 Tax=Leptonychotes weddellii TaxID=9713 RepID=A0A2U3Z3T8_LEPWE|nr:regulator of G-protein signaling 8 [Leptonychotes weddellii]